MKKSRFSEEQIIGFLRQAEAGLPVKELCRRVDAQSDLIPIHRHLSSTRTHFNWVVLKFKEAPEYCATLQTDC